ncbi:hypothetical protein RAO12_06720 [Ornithobacterium rhinotracheale]|uniref:hypothetical protein n=1 Tax=Ornithobacterium rhinotracheale TaxID=28251 RepID=UPI003873B38C
MKRIILITLSAISLWACDKQHKKTDAEEWGLKGKVKSVKQTTYAAVEHLGKVRKGWNIDYEDLFLKEITANYYKVFDEKGNQIEGDWYDLYGNVLYKDTYAYDEKGNQTEEVRYKSDGKIDVKIYF